MVGVCALLIHQPGKALLGKMFSLDPDILHSSETQRREVAV